MCLPVDLAADLTVAFDHADSVQPGPAMALLKPSDVVDDGYLTSFDTAMIGVNGGIMAHLRIREVRRLLFVDEEFNIFTQ
jgi:hypothetical protein